MRRLLIRAVNWLFLLLSLALLATAAAGQFGIGPATTFDDGLKLVWTAALLFFVVEGPRVLAQGARRSSRQIIKREEAEEADDA